MSQLIAKNTQSIPQSQLGPSPRQADVCIVALDSLLPARKLLPGEPISLAKGVTISVLQTAAEALLEIDHEATATTQVDQKNSSEVMTVHTGQIIKTSEGRFVMIRHLEAFIIPRDADWRRPQEFQQAIDLAIAAVVPDSAVVPQKAALVIAETEHSPTGMSKRTLVRAALGVGVFATLSLAFLLPGSHNEVAPKPTVSEPSKQEVAKSKIIATSEVPTTVTAEETRSQKLNNPKDTRAQEFPQTKPASNPPSRSRPAAKSHAAQASVVGPQSSDVRLTEKDRQTIFEYKLEAKFDRSNARAKLKHFAESFPVGSSARREVEKAYQSL